MENAVEACQRQLSENKTIFIAGQLQDGHLDFVIDNSFNEELKTMGGKHLSSKRDGFGLGISSVLEIVDRYNGIINLYVDKKTFHVEISLPLV
ncbi:MAG TPA: sensor histidine kinase [Clostridiales bacterium]|nr:sensor histidine kinase [Clostridiales bacterium]